MTAKTIKSGKIADDDRRKFDPARVASGRDQDPSRAGYGDLRHSGHYVYPPRAVLAVNVALVTQRPLLVRGPTGCGKSSLAREVARVLGWRLYERVITSRTEARDLLWRFDAVKRLSDAHAKDAKAEGAYLNPGLLWWAMSHKTAAT